VSSRPFRLSRRDVLRGAGALVALPTLEAMLGSGGVAYADGTPLPLRFGIFFFGNGVIRSRWVPAQVGATWSLSEELSPLANVKDYVNVASGREIKVPDLRGHHNGAAAILSATPFIPIPPNGAPYSSKFGGPSIDQVAADVIGLTTPIKSLQLAVSKRPEKEQGPTVQFVSHRGPDSPLAPEVSPANLFTRLFGGGLATDPRTRARLSALDAVRDDARRLQQRLGAADRARLDAHLTAISEVRREILATAPPATGACVVPPAPAETNADVNGNEPLQAVSRAMSDLLALAWACDLTRVATFQHHGATSSTVFAAEGQIVPEHLLTHDVASQDQVHDAVMATMRNCAYLLEKLKATPEGAGNVLDRSCVLITTDVCEGLFHSGTDYPILVAGCAGGALKYPGVHDRSTASENTSDVLLSCLRAVGTGLTSVGGDTAASSTPCAGILG
jgi:uncharacterized protein DUF1552